jgi:glycosyltransferase involved in cell wall biosynthesis
MDKLMEFSENKAEREKPNISLCMIVRNELENLKKHLLPIVDEFSEVVVVDTGSNDGTREYLNTLSDNVKVIDFSWIDDFSAARNQYIKKATRDWIYWMDADEYLDSSYVRILKECSEKGKGTAWSYRYGHYMSESHIRLFPNIPGVKYVMRCHEQIKPSLRKAGVQKFRFLPHPFNIINPSYAGAPEESRLRNIRLLKLDIEEKPEYLLSYVYLAYIYCELAEYDNAIEVLEQGLSRNPPNTTLDIHGRMAAMHARQLITFQKTCHEKVDRGEDLSREELEELGRLARQDPY